MFVVIFESTTPPAKGAISGEYYTTLQKLLLGQPGFISETPYASIDETDGGLLVARFKDAAAVYSWRTNPVHLQIQRQSREEVFDDYRIRVGPEVDLLTVENVRDENAPDAHTTKTHQTLVLLEHPQDKTSEAPDLDTLRSKGPEGELVGVKSYQSEASVLRILSWDTEQAAQAFIKAASLPEYVSVSCTQIARDYGKKDRNQAPKGADKAQARAGLHDSVLEGA